MIGVQILKLTTMEMHEFIEKLAEAIEVDQKESLTENTRFKDLDEWSSLSVMFLIAFYDEEFGKEISDKEIRNSSTIDELYNLAIA